MKKADFVIAWPHGGQIQFLARNDAGGYFATTDEADAASFPTFAAAHAVHEELGQALNLPEAAILRHDEIEQQFDPAAPSPRPPLVDPLVALRIELGLSQARASEAEAAAALMRDQLAEAHEVARSAMRASGRIARTADKALRQIARLRETAPDAVVAAEKHVEREIAREAEEAELRAAAAAGDGD